MINILYYSLSMMWWINKKKDNKCLKVPVVIKSAACDTLAKRELQRKKPQFDEEYRLD